MKYFTEPAAGRCVVLSLGKGDLILESIEKACEELGIRNAVVTSAIGSARKVVFHYIESTADDPVNTFVTIDEACEIGSIQGLILNGEAHLHISFSDRSRAYNGHLEPGCEVQYLLEVSLMEMKDMNLTRKPDSFGISYIDRC